MSEFIAFINFHEIERMIELWIMSHLLYSNLVISILIYSYLLIFTFTGSFDNNNNHNSHSWIFKSIILSGNYRN